MEILSKADTTAHHQRVHVCSNNAHIWAPAIMEHYSYSTEMWHKVEPEENVLLKLDWTGAFIRNGLELVWHFY